jgi:hypothetical protein
MHHLATYNPGVPAAEHQGEPPDLTAVIADLGGAVHAACAAHCTDASLRFEHNRGPWGNGWQSAFWAYMLLRCVMLGGDALSTESHAAARRVVEFECDRFIGVTPPTGVIDDTKAEENGWDATVLAWASFAYPDHSHAADWEKAARLWCFNALTTAADKFDRRPFEDGKPLSAWVAGACLHPDFTCENHGTFHPNYQATVMFSGLIASAYTTHNKPVPPALLHNLKEAAEVAGYFTARDTTQLMVTGNDWATYHGLHSNIALLARFTHDPRWIGLAHENISRFERFLEQSDNGHIFGSTLRGNKHEQEFFFHTCNSSLLADIYPVMPLELPPRPGIVGFGGTRCWRYVEVVTQRDDNRLASMAWRTLYNHPLATVLPVNLPGTSLAAWAPYTGIGRFVLKSGDALTAHVLTHHETTTSHGYATSGVIEWRDPAGVPLIHQHLEMHAKGGEPVMLKEKSTALAHVELSANDQWTMSLSNDLHNGSSRKVKDQRGKVHTVRSLTHKESTVWGGFQIVVDDMIRYEADRELTYFSPGERLLADNRFQCTQFDRVLVRAGVGSFEPADTVRAGILRIEVS